MENTQPSRSHRYRRLLLFVGLPMLIASSFLAGHADAFGPWHHTRHTAHGWHGLGEDAKSPDDLRTQLTAHLQHMLRELDTSEAQKKSIQGVVDRVAPQLFVLLQEGNAVHDEVSAAVLADSIDPARVDRARQRLDDLAVRASTLIVGTTRDMASLLTPAQRRRLAQEMSHRPH